MELRHLRTFAAVAEHRSLSVAARHLGLAQPAVSQQMNALEAELGVSLLIRKPRGVELTRAGARLLLDARAMVAQEESAKAAARAVARGMEGTLRVGFELSAAFGSLADHFAEFGRRYPGLAVELVEMCAEEQLAEIRQGTLDAGICRAVDESPDFRTRQVSRERLVVALPEGHPLATCERLELCDLASEPFLVLPRKASPEVFDAFLTTCHAHRFEPKLWCQSSQMVTLLVMVAAGLGVAVVPELLSQVSPPGVVFLPLDHPSAVCGMFLVALREWRNPSAKRLWEYAESVPLIDRAAVGEGLENRASVGR